MQYDDLRSLSSARLDHARECLTSAEQLLRTGDFKGSANRSYYAVFHAMRSVLAFDEIDMKRHSGIISEFRKRYVKTGIFSEEMSDIIGQAFDVRTDCDYDDFYVIDKQEVEEQLSMAQVFVNAVEAYLTRI